MDVFTKPNWSGGVTDTLEFRTTVFTTDDGNEQRSAERAQPRRTTAFTALLHGDSLRKMQAILHSRFDDVCTVPDPVRLLGTVTTYAAAGAGSILIDATLSAAFVGSTISVQSPSGQYFATVSAISGNRVAFSAAAGAESLIGAEVRACFRGRFPSTVTVSMVTDDKATCSISVAQVPGDPVRNFGNAEYQIFRNREVLVEQPNWAAPPSVDFVGAYDTTDYGRGVISTYNPIGFISKITQFSYLGRDRDRIGRLIDFYLRQMGRLGEFWCPSWTTDYRMTANIVSGTSTLRLAGTAAAEHYAPLDVERAIAIKLTNGNWRFIYAASIAVSGSETVITSDVPFTFNVVISEVAGIYSLNVCRLASDTMTVQWVTDQVAQTVLQINTLQVLPAEVL